MKYLNLETFSDFVCTGSECPFTCCGGGWNIYIDDDTYEFYMSVKGEFGERLRKNIQKKNGKASFILDENYNCPFLNERKLCDVYLNIGEEHLCDTCTYYPRFSFRSGDICFAGVAISCPEVSKFFLTHTEPLLIDFSDDDIPVENEDKINWEFFNHAVRAFTGAVGIAQNRELTISERLAILNVFIYQFQSCVDQESDPASVIALFSDPSSYLQILPQTNIYERDYNTKISFISEILNYYNQLPQYRKFFPEPFQFSDFFRDPENAQITNERWIEAFADTLNRNNEIWQEHILVYILFRYFMRGFDSCDFFNRFITGQLLIFVSIICLLSLYRIQNNHTAALDYMALLTAHASRLVEHSSDVVDPAMSRFKEKGMLELPFILKLIS